jgi:hypothetical protein
MNRLAIYLIITYLTALFTPTEAKSFRTETFRDDIKSLEVRVGGEMISTPIIELGSQQTVEISFDALHHTAGRFAYTIIHCNADWSPSVLLPVEFMKGFNNLPIDDYKNSFNTTTLYANYLLTLPNENTQPIVSGNYAVKIYDEDNPEDVVLTACFSIAEPLVDIAASISGNTDIDFNKTHQQVEFTVFQKNINIVFPQSELKIFVRQNNNAQDVRTGLQPAIIKNKELLYSHNRNLIFEAGNEYRRIEFRSRNNYGMGVDKIRFFDPYYNVTLFSDRRRNNKTYLYDEDQNGRFFVNCNGCASPRNEADYYIVHFALETKQLDDGDVFLYGDVFNNTADERSRMIYNSEKGAYEKAVLLKQGLYNYLYAFKPYNSDNMTFINTEGNYFETENEYLITVYYHPAGARFDRLIGYKTVSNGKQ